VTLYLIRHAKAGRRSQWTGRDADRPLSSKGRHQADGLVDLLAGRPVGRVLSSPSVRCQQTVAPLARDRGLEVEVSPALDEGAEVADAMRLLAANDSVDAALCSHGDVIPAVIDHLAATGADVQGPESAAKGSVYVIEVDGERFATATYLDPPA
jgi:8-oxo-dGTP diphosphatase